MENNSEKKVYRIIAVIAVVLVLIGGAVIARDVWTAPTDVVTPTPAPTDTPSPIPTDTPTPIPTDTPTPTSTDTPTSSPTDTPAPSPTDTPTPSPTDTPIPTSTPSPTPSDTTLGLNCPQTGPGQPVEYLDFNIETTDAHRDFFANTLFTGDSLMTHFKMKYWDVYGAESAYVKALNLSVVSYSMGAAMDGAPQIKLEDGQKYYIWDVIRILDCPRVVMEFGANDLLYGVDNFIANCGRMVDKITESRPGTDIVFINIPTMNHYRETPTFLNKYGDYCGLNNDNIRRANDKLREFCNNRNLGYIDLYRYIVDETGHLSQPYNNGDSIHQNRTGYLIWNQLMLKYAESHMSE